MKTFSLSFFALFLGATLAFGTQQDRKQDKKPKISANTLRELNQEIIPALEMSDYETAAKLISPFLIKAKPEMVELIDKHLTDRGHPKATKVYATDMIQIVEHGLRSFVVEKGKVKWRGGRLDPKEFAIVAPYLADRLRNDFKTVEDSTVMKGTEKLPEDWHESEKFFWSFHVRRNRLETLHNLAKWGELHATKSLKFEEDISDKTLVSQLKLMMGKTAAVEKMMVRLGEQEAVYRFTQLKGATERVAASTDFRSRFTNMTSVKSAMLFFEHFLVGRDYPADLFENQTLKDPNFPDKVKALADQAYEGQADLVRKVELFQQGLHWWFRGRYGNGPNHNGHLKSINALRSEQDMFGLFMPNERPFPSLPFFRENGEMEPESERAPDFQRRHFYTWEIGHRSFSTSSQSKSVLTGTTKQTRTVKGFW